MSGAIDDVTWARLVQSGEWVSGVAERFEYGAAKWSRVEDEAAQLADDFDKLSALVQCKGDEFAGEAATAFVGMLTDARSLVDQVRPFAAGINRILKHHETELRALRERVRVAVAVAQTNWNRMAREASAAASARARAEALSRQAEQVRLNGDPVVQAYAQQVLVSRDRARSEAAWASRQVNTLRSAIREDQRVYDALEKQEESLNELTAQELSRKELLGELRDLEWYEQASNQIGKFFSDLYENNGQMWLAVFEGDWARAFHELRDVLESLIVIAGIIVIVASIVLLTIGTGGAFGAFLAMALPLLAQAIFIGASLKLIVTHALFATGTVHPETGKRLSGWDVISDALGVVAAAVGVPDVAKTVARASVVGFGRSRLLTTTAEVLGLPSVRTGGWSANALRPTWKRWIFKQVSGVDLTRSGPRLNRRLFGATHTYGLKVLEYADHTRDIWEKNPLWTKLPDYHYFGIEKTHRDRLYEKRQDFILKEIDQTRAAKESFVSPVRIYVLPPRFRSSAPGQPVAA